MAERVMAVHFIVQQDLPLSKFGPLLELLKESGSPYLEHTKLSARVLFENKVSLIYCICAVFQMLINM